MGKLDLISCDLSKSLLYIDNVKLIDIFYTDCQFPNEILSRKTNTNEKLSQQRDTYGQFKSVSEKIGNRFYALDFHSKEMNKYYLSKKGNKEDRTILFLMKYSNNFRQSPINGIVFTIIVGIIPYLLFITLYQDNFDWGLYGFNETFDVFKKYFGGYFEFLNPTHKVDFLGSIKNANAYLPDFLGRILIGFGIYQTIQAFRKFGKEN